VHDTYFQEPTATVLELKRQAARVRGRIPFDCFHAIYPAKGSRVKCRHDHRMGSGSDKGMELVSVMSGRSGAGCRRCVDYNGD